MAEHALLGIALITALGVAAQWISWRLRIPSILPLLLFGFLTGPVFQLVDPDKLFGSVLFPIVSVSVAIILFEGGLNLKFRELTGVRDVITRLLTIGTFVTWVIATLAAIHILKLDTTLAILLGAILTVSGPTVVNPILRQVRPRPPASEILKWEGILIDPVGALLAVLVFEAILEGQINQTPYYVLRGVASTVLIGGFTGSLGAVLTSFLFSRYLIPDYLQNAFILSLVISVHAASNWGHPESGLFAVTLMAILLANMKNVTLRNIVEFKESLSTLIVSSLFILLSSRIQLEQLRQLDWLAVGTFLAVLVFIARPATAFLSTVGSDLKLRDKAFIAWMAPRGIVAAAVASLFGFELAKLGHPQAELLAPYTFVVIVGTVIIYGVTARPLAQALKLTRKSPQGVLFVGANPPARAIAALLQNHGFSVILVDTNVRNVFLANNDGLPAHHGNIVSESTLDQVDLDGIGQLLAMTPNQEANSLAAIHLSELFDSSRVYQLPERNGSSNAEASRFPMHLTGRTLFSEQCHSLYLSQAINSGAQLKCTDITDQFSYEDYCQLYGTGFIPLFRITEQNELDVFSPDREITLRSGQQLISLVRIDQSEQTNDDTDIWAALAGLSLD